MHASEIIERVAAIYGNCNSYTDTGSVDFVGVEGEPERIEFRTYFESPEKFRFEWSGYHPLVGRSERVYSIFFDGERTFCQFVQDSPEEQNDFLEAWAGSIGISSAAAFQIPPLLLPRLRIGKHLLCLDDVALVEHDLVNDCSCVVLRGSGFQPNDLNLWISDQDMYIRRIRIDRTVNQKTTTSVYLYKEVTFDGAISSAIFQTS